MAERLIEGRGGDDLTGREMSFYIDVSKIDAFFLDMQRRFGSFDRG